jgi:uncharacterized membrane protein YjjP (DUF1212 family)
MFCVSRSHSSESSDVFYTLLFPSVMSLGSLRRPSGARRSSLSVFTPAPSMARRRSGVRSGDEDKASAAPLAPMDLPDNLSRCPISPRASALHRTTAPDWHMPLYGASESINRNVHRSQFIDVAGTESVEEFPIRQGGQQLLSVGPFDTRRGSTASEITLRGEDEQFKKFSLSSYKHPYDIPVPAHAFSASNPQPHPSHSDTRFPAVLAESINRHGPNCDEEKQGPAYKRHGLISSLIDLYGVNHNPEPTMSQSPDGSRRQSEAISQFSAGYDDIQGEDHMYFQVMDPDHPSVTGIRKEFLEDPEDRRMQAMRLMDYKQRRKERAKITIEFNISSILNRQLFLITLARALMTFGAPSHRIESQLIAAAKILEVESEFIHLPGVIICSFGDEGTKTSETHFVKCGSRLSLGSLHMVHHIYRAVLHDEISAKRATRQLDELLSAKPLYPVFLRCVLAFILSALICPLAFGGSFLDMWIAGSGAFVLCLLQLCVATKNAMYANVFECVLMSIHAGSRC